MASRVLGHDSLWYLPTALDSSPHCNLVRAAVMLNGYEHRRVAEDSRQYLVV